MTFDEAHRLIKRGYVLELRRALDAGLDPNLSQRFGVTLLMLAAITGNSSVGRLLIERGARSDARDMRGNTALSDAIMFGCVEFVRLLLEHGASSDRAPHGGSLDGFLDWCEQYTQATPEQIKKIRILIEAEKQKREQRNGNA